MSALNPDCRDGKHSACRGDAFEVTTDTATSCGCWCHGPRPTTSERYIPLTSSPSSRAILVNTMARLGLFEPPPAIQYREVIEPVDPYGYEITLVSTTDSTVRKGTWHAITLKGATRKARKLVKLLNHRQQQLRARRIRMADDIRTNLGDLS